MLLCEIESKNIDSQFSNNENTWMPVINRYW